MANRDFFRRLGLADEVALSTLAKLRQPRTLRRVLLMAGPALVLAAGLFFYMAGGRYVSTDNAYVHAGKLTVATDVSGIVSDVAVHESQKVEKGQVDAVVSEFRKYLQDRLRDAGEGEDTLPVLRIE